MEFNKFNVSIHASNVSNQIQSSEIAEIKSFGPVLTLAAMLCNPYDEETRIYAMEASKMRQWK